jgi:NitT/TauT family transport system ATP-binding protein
MTASAALIAIDTLGKRYHTRSGEVVDALHRITMHVAEGEFLCIVGPSGCGKTTLLNILAGLSTPSEGTVTLRGQARLRRADIGVVFQDSVLFPWRTVLRNVELPIELLKLDRERYRSRARELIDLVGLQGFEDKYPNELSGGMQQRVSMARALVHDPPLLLMDEPFGALDALTREQMNLELLSIWQRAKKTVLFITHSITEAVFLADRVAVMTPRPGRIAGIVPIELPRPRELEMTGLARFAAYTTELRRLLSVKSRAE